MSSTNNDLKCTIQGITALSSYPSIDSKVANEKTKMDNTPSKNTGTKSTTLIFSQFSASQFAMNHQGDNGYIYPTRFISIKAITEAILTKKGSWRGGWPVSVPNTSASDTEMKRFNQVCSAIRTSTNFKEELTEIIRSKEERTGFCEDSVVFNHKTGNSVVVALRGGFCLVLVENENGLTSLTISIANKRVEIIENPKPMVVDVDTLKVIPELEARLEIECRIAQAKAFKIKEGRKLVLDVKAKEEFDKTCAMIENSQNYSKELSELTPDIHEILRKKDHLRTQAEIDSLAKYNANELFASAKNETIVYKHMQNREPSDKNIYNRIFRREIMGKKFTRESPKLQYYYENHLAVYIFEAYNVFGAISGNDRIVSEIHVAIDTPVIVHQRDKYGDLKPLPNSKVTVNNGVLKIHNEASRSRSC